MRAFRPEPDDTGSRLKEVDFTGRAHELLFELITIHAETTLADIFRLMEASPLLQEFCRRDFVEELCAEARKGAAEPSARARPGHEGIEFLELHQEWGLDTSTKEYSGMQRLHRIEVLNHHRAAIGRNTVCERTQRGRLRPSSFLEPAADSRPQPRTVSTSVPEREWLMSFEVSRAATVAGGAGIDAALLR